MTNLLLTLKQGLLNHAKLASLERTELDRSVIGMVQVLCDGRRERWFERVMVLFLFYFIIFLCIRGLLIL